MAISAPLNDGNGINSGHVRIFSFGSGDWRQKGEDIVGKNAGDYSGLSVSLSDDGKTVAIVGGNVRIYNHVEPQIGNAIIFSANCADTNSSSCYKVVHSIGKTIKDVNVDLMGEGCKYNLQADVAIILDPFPFEEDEFSYDVNMINKYQTTN